MLDKNGSKPPKNMHGNMRPDHGSTTPTEAIGRSGGAPGKQIPDEITVTKVSKSSLTKILP